MKKHDAMKKGDAMQHGGVMKKDAAANDGGGTSQGQ